MSARLTLPARRNHITPKVRIGGHTLYISVHGDPAPAEIFLRVKGTDCTSKTIALYDVIARLMSIPLQYGAFLKNIGDLLACAQSAPRRPIVGYDRLKQCSSLLDLIGRPCWEVTADGRS